MIVYNYSINQEALFDYNDTVSQKTGNEFTYSYYVTLCKKFRERTLSDDEYYDWEISMLKYDTNRKL